MTEVCVVAAGSSRFGELWDRSAADLMREAWKDCGLAAARLDGLFVSSMAAGSFIGQEHVGAFALDAIGGKGIPSTRLEAACASGGAAFRNAFISIKSGQHKVAGVIGFEKMTDVSPAEAGRILVQASAAESEAAAGATFPSLYALMAARHMRDFGTTEAQMAAVAVKNHLNATRNAKAHFRKEITLDEALKSEYVARPLKVLDCSPVSDGAAAVVLAEASLARKLCPEHPVRVLASSQASDTLELAKRDSLTGLKATALAARDAFGSCGLSPASVDFAEVHDCFTIAEIMALEDLGFFRKGEAAAAGERGETGMGGRIPTNPSGGLKAKGHPVGATGVAQIVECFLQLTGRAEGRQVKGARVGLAHNVGGSGATAVVSILGAGGLAEK